MGASPQASKAGESRCRRRQVVCGMAPAGNAFWRILNATERSLLHLFPDALSSSNSVSCHIRGQGQGLGGGAVAPKLEPWHA